MKLNTLLNGVDILSIFYNNLPTIKQKCNINVEKITLSHNECTPNSLYFALKGASFNGENFISEAIRQKATVIVSEKFVKLNNPAFMIIVENARKAMAQIAANFYERAHKKLKIIGITGTNGKSSCGYILKSLLDKLYDKKIGFKSALIGTNAVMIGSKRLEATLTTPDPIKLHELFYKIYQDKCKVVVMEISAHSIYLNKIYGLSFEALCLTNIKSDHLDFFKTQSAYIKTKESLFLNYPSRLYVLNLNDKYGNKIFDLLKENKNVLGYKKNCYLKHSNQVAQYKQRRMGLNSSEFSVYFKNKVYNLKSSLTGEINIQNICLAICVLHQLNIKMSKIAPLLKTLDVEGRLNIFEYSKNIRFILDYAHTFSSTKEVLKIVKKYSKRKIITVIGAPGNRDEFKRKKTASIVKKFGDIILTSDNPKYENPYKIMEEMKKGATSETPLIENRENAIKYALKKAIESNKKYNILVLGKGIETYQDYNGKHIYYSDLNTILTFINNE